MKPIIFCLIFLTFLGVQAQVQTPQPSPSSTLKQVVGLTNFEVNYSRPSMNDRKIFGDLVPYEKMWRTGANANTTISFDQDITIANKDIKAGKYALYTKPGKKSWKIYLYDKTDSWGLPQKWDESKVVLVNEVRSKKISETVESFTIDFSHFNKESAHLILKWENTLISIPVGVPTDKMVMRSIEKTMKNPKPTDYFNAAVYFLETDRDINQARQWIDKAMELSENKPYWMLRQQSLIYAKAGEKNEAIQLAKQSLEAAEKAGNRDYVNMNKASLEEWGAF